MKVPGKFQVNAETAQKQVFMQNVCNEFKHFVCDSIADGIDDEFDDHLVFLERCMETFIQIKNEGLDE